MGNGTDHTGRNADLRRGLRIHTVIFVVTIGLLFLINAATRGSDGDWWIVWPLTAWAFAWAAHVTGVLQITYFRKQLDEFDGGSV